MKDKRIWEFKRRAEEDNLITAGACRLILRIASWRYCTKHHPADSEFSLGWRSMAAWYDNEGPERVRHKRTIYGWMRELVLARYLHHNGLKGCPAQACYRLDLDHKPERLTLFDWAAERGDQVVKKSLVRDAGNGVAVGQKTAQLDGQKTARLVGQKKGQLVGRKTAQLVGQKNTPPINRYSLREETDPKRKKVEPRSARSVGKEDLFSAPERVRERDLPDRSEMVAPTGPKTNAPRGAKSGKESAADDRAMQGCNPRADAGRSGQTHRAGGEQPPASSGPRVSREQQRDMDLHTAKLYVEMETPQHMEIRHVMALVRAKLPVPPEAARKFPALKLGKKKRELAEVLA